MRLATVRSRCECQSSLVAVLNENRHVTSAYAVDRDGSREEAPGHTMGAQNARFDVGWLCPVCGRNVLRSFATDALAWRETPEVPAGAAASAASGADAIAPAAAAAAAGAPAVGGAPAAGSGPGVGHQQGASAVKLAFREARPAQFGRAFHKAHPAQFWRALRETRPAQFGLRQGAYRRYRAGTTRAPWLTAAGQCAANAVRDRRGANSGVTFGRALAFGG